MAGLLNLLGEALRASVYGCQALRPQQLDTEMAQLGAASAL